MKKLDFLRWKYIKKKIQQKKFPYLRLPLRLLLYLATLILAILSILESGKEAGDTFYAALEVGIYSLSGILFFLSVFYLLLDLAGLREKFDGVLERIPWLCRIVRDMEWRTELMAMAGLLLNIAFALFNAAMGWLNDSPWLGTMAAYYILLSLMRYDWVRQNRSIWRRNREKSRTKSRRSIWLWYGILFCFMAIVLSGVVILLVHLEGGKEYAGVTIYGVAAYAFCKIVLAIINRIRAGKRKILSLMVLRDIGYVDACVSLLSLQTALLSAFSGPEEMEFSRRMNGITGGVISFMILLLGISYLWKAKAAGNK